MTKNKNLIAEVSISYSNHIPIIRRKRIRQGKDAYDILFHCWNQATIELYEEFKILLLNRANDVLGVSTISRGSTSGTLVDAKLIFATALKANASSIILSHNHPSGGLQPSTADIEITKKLKIAAEFLDISVLDHLIITKDGYYSFADSGTL